MTTTTTTMTQVRLPAVLFRRWLHRSHTSLPVPLAGLNAVRVPLDLDVVTELRAPRIAGSATPAQLEGIDAPTARVLDGLVDLATTARAVCYAIRSDGATQTTVAGLVGAREGMLVVDGPDEIALRPLPAAQVADAVVRALPPLRGAEIRPLDVSLGALQGLSGPSGAGRDGRRRVADLAGIDVAQLDELDRIQTGRRTMGVIGACRPGDMASGPAADWFESARGAVLKHPAGQGALHFAPADRSTLTRFLVTAIAAVS